MLPSHEFVYSRYWKPQSRNILVPRSCFIFLAEKEAHKIKNTIGLATIYRVLTQFESAGLVIRHNFEGGQAIFELDSGEHHDHIVDMKSGKIIEFHDNIIEKRQIEIAKEHGYKLVDHCFILYAEPLE